MFRLHLALKSRSIHIVPALWLALPSELEAFHLYSEQCLTSIACCGHKAARSQHHMLTDSLPKPHLPYTEQEKGTERRREDWMQTDGWLGTKVQKDNPRLCPLFYNIPSPVSRCRSAEHLCQKFIPPWGSSVFPKERR